MSFRCWSHKNKSRALATVQQRISSDQLNIRNFNNTIESSFRSSIVRVSVWFGSTTLSLHDRGHESRELPASRRALARSKRSARAVSLCTHHSKVFAHILGEPAIFEFDDAKNPGSAEPGTRHAIFGSGRVAVDRCPRRASDARSIRNPDPVGGVASVRRRLLDRRARRSSVCERGAAAGDDAPRGQLRNGE
mmetsp:Transcript_2651/g.7241  ORF Transcript_2651/g.7241 Transcript_2651/m.7241 type:complete len:192 (-) Transcript_2651:997-1572(-)